MNRGARRATVFLDSRCCERFVALLGELPARFGVRVHAFALMGNHYHLLLEAGPGGLGRALQYLQAQYSRWLNRSQGWDGPIWARRYRSRPIFDEDYLRHVLAYIHLNPVASGAAPSVSQAEWTSHAFYVGDAQAPQWLTRGTLLAHFGSVGAYLEYVDAVRQGRESGPRGFDADLAWTAPRRQVTLPPERAPLQPPGGMSWDAAWVALERATDMPRLALVQRSRGPGAARTWWVTMWWMQRATLLRTGEVAARLGVHASQVSRARRRIAELAGDDAWLAAVCRRLEAERRRATSAAPGLGRVA